MVAPADQALVLPLTSIHASAANPRRSYNLAADSELYASIRAHGILTPLLVRPVDDWHGDDLYEVVAGHRRFAAAQELGLEAVPVTIRQLTDDQAREAAIIENMQREDLAPLDEAAAYQALLARPGQTPAMVAAAVGKSPAYVGRRLKLLTLVPEAQTALREGRLGVAHAELLTKLDPVNQEKALDEAVWLDLFAGLHDGDDRRVERTTAALSSLSELREWVDRRTKLDLADPEALALFPEADELVSSAATDADDPLEVALDLYGQSPAKATIPAGVLKLNKDFREVAGKRCKGAERAIVVFGQRKGDVVLVCRDKKGCTTHWPPKEKTDPAAKAAKRPSWEEDERERKRLRAIWEHVRPDVERVLITASAKVKTTPKLLQEILEESRGEVAATIKAIGGKLTLDNFGRAWVLANALIDLYDHNGAERALKAVNGYFDVKKAMKAAEAAMAVEAAAAKAETKKGAGAKTPAKKSRRVA